MVSACDGHSACGFTLIEVKQKWRMEEELRSRSGMLGTLRVSASLSRRLLSPQVKPCAVPGLIIPSACSSVIDHVWFIG